MVSRMPSAWYRTQARTLYQDEGRIEVDGNAPVSRNKERKFDHGAYVQAWIWVADPEATENRRTGV